MGYTHMTTLYWKVVSDSSVNNSGTCTVNGLELVSPILSGREGLNELKVAVSALRNAGAMVDESCGLHVHHDAYEYSDKDIGRVVMLYARWEKVIDYTVKPSRRGNENSYCKSFEGLPWEELRHCNVFDWSRRYGITRYWKVNVEAYNRHGTIEFRQHHGTLDPDEITAWVVFTQNIMEKAKAGAKVTRNIRNLSFKNLRDMLGASTVSARDSIGLAAYRIIAKNFKKFAGLDGITIYSGL